MRAGGLEIGRLAFGELMNVNGMVAGREVLKIEFDANALGGGRKSSGADILALNVLEFDGDGFYGVRMGLPCRGNEGGEEKQGNREDLSHEFPFVDFTQGNDFGKHALDLL